MSQRFAVLLSALALTISANAYADDPVSNTLKGIGQMGKTVVNGVTTTTKKVVGGTEKVVGGTVKATGQATRETGKVVGGAVKTTGQTTTRVIHGTAKTTDEVLTGRSQ